MVSSEGEEMASSEGEAMASSEGAVQPVTEQQMSWRDRRCLFKCRDVHPVIHFLEH